MVSAVMFQGTGSDVGKSFVVAGLCRALANRGLSVLPFKPQNMSNNAAVTAGGGEIGRAQALQAQACRAEACVDMNPVLLKPQSDSAAQIVVQGKVHATSEARDYILQERWTLLAPIRESFERLQANADIVLIEGAGSPAEVNLRHRDVANMGFARCYDVPVVLVGDIARGGVIANLVGTHALLGAADRALIAGVLINKFRGDISLFADGLRAITQATGWPAYGVLPLLPEAALLPAEDAVSLERRNANHDAPIRIAVPMLPRIANFDDIDPLAAEPDVEVIMVPPGRALPGDAHAVIVPGTKSTIADLQFLRARGWDIDLRAHVRRGGHVLGLCGGFQMLGRTITDADGAEGPAGAAAGLGLLDVETVMRADKTVTRLAGTCTDTGACVTGYEIHIGETTGPDTADPFLRLSVDGRERAFGARDAGGRIAGCYIHGLFESDDFRHSWLNGIRQRGPSPLQFSRALDEALDTIAQRMEEHLDIDGIIQLAAR